MKAQLIITVEDDGQIKVAGLLQDKILCYGLLGVAHDIIRDYKASDIVVPDLRLRQ